MATLDPFLRKHFRQKKGWRVFSSPQLISAEWRVKAFWQKVAPPDWVPRAWATKSITGDWGGGGYASTIHMPSSSYLTMRRLGGSWKPMWSAWMNWTSMIQRRRSTRRRRRRDPGPPLSEEVETPLNGNWMRWRHPETATNQNGSWL